MTPWVQGAGRIPLQLATVITFFIGSPFLLSVGPFLSTSRLLLSHDDQSGPPSKPPLFLQDKVSGIIPLQLATVIAFHTSLPYTRGKNVSLCTGLPYPVANPVLYDSFIAKKRQNSAAVGNRDCIWIGQSLCLSLWLRVSFFNSPSSQRHFLVLDHTQEAHHPRVGHHPRWGHDCRRGLHPAGWYSCFFISSTTPIFLDTELDGRMRFFCNR